jgi:hypothetical protein
MNTCVMCGDPYEPDALDMAYSRRVEGASRQPSPSDAERVTVCPACVGFSVEIGYRILIDLTCRNSKVVRWLRRVLLRWAFRIDPQLRSANAELSSFSTTSGKSANAGTSHVE